MGGVGFFVLVYYIGLCFFFGLYYGIEDFVYVVGQDYVFDVDVEYVGVQVCYLCMYVYQDVGVQCGFVGQQFVQ